MKTYKAPWSTLLILTSSLVTLLCAGISTAMIWDGRGVLPWMAILPLAIVLASAPFTILGYTLTPRALLVHRLFWTTHLPLAGLKTARADPQAMRRSIRTLGNGGLFSFTGRFWNKALGSYRAFVTDPRRAVVLRYSDRTVVVSPSSPEDFVRAIESVRIAA